MDYVHLFHRNKTTVVSKKVSGRSVEKNPNLWSLDWRGRKLMGAPTRGLSGQEDYTGAGRSESSNQVPLVHRFGPSLLTLKNTTSYKRWLWPPPRTQLTLASEELTVPKVVSLTSLSLSVRRFSGLRLSLRVSTVYLFLRTVTREGSQIRTEGRRTSKNLKDSFEYKGPLCKGKWGVDRP